MGKLKNFILLLFCCWAIGGAAKAETVELTNENFKTAIGTTGDYVLTENIILNSGITFTENGASTTEGLESWSPKSFSGTLDGNGYSISGLYINSTSSNQGLFSKLSGTVKNLTIKNSYINGKSNVGTIAGNIFGESLIQNCTNYAFVSSNSGDKIGGFVGSVSAGDAKVEILDCQNSGMINGDESIGGICGDVSSSNVYIVDCINDGYVAGNSRVGGIVGRVNAVGCTISLCYNGIGESYDGSNSGVYGKKYVGGIVGSLKGTSEIVLAYVANCYNIGTVTGGEGAGGIVGYLYSYCDVSYCFNWGELISLDDANRIGAILGKIDGDGTSIKTYANNYYVKIGNITGVGSSSGTAQSDPDGVSELTDFDGNSDIDIDDILEKLSMWRIVTYSGSTEIGTFVKRATTVNYRATSSNISAIDFSRLKASDITQDGEIENTLITVSATGVAICNNSLIYCPNSLTAAIANNIITYNAGYKISSLSLDNTSSFYCPIEFTADAATLVMSSPLFSRPSDAGGWQCISLPFDADLYAGDDKKNPYKPSTDEGDYWLKEISSYSDGTLRFSYASEIKANTPYILALPGRGYDEYDLSDKTISFKKNNTDNIAVTDISKLTAAAAGNSSLEFVASFESITDNVPDGYDYYELNSDGSSFNRVTASLDVKPFSAYIKLGTSSGASRLPSLRIGSASGTETSLPALNGKAEVKIWSADAVVYVYSEKAVKVSVYDLTGKLVSSKNSESEETVCFEGLEKGIYIVNGKKVVL